MPTLEEFKENLLALLDIVIKKGMILYERIK